MPIFFQQQINEYTRLGVWKIEETEAFFKGNVPQHRHVTHPQKRLQHLAGRFLLQYLFADFPYALVQIADTRKPFLPDEQYHFSISHCGDYAAAIVSSIQRVGVDVEVPAAKILKITDKFLSKEEYSIFNIQPAVSTEVGIVDKQLPTVLWSAKEAVFKWYGAGSVDFKEHIRLMRHQPENETIDCLFSKTGTELVLHYRLFDELVLSWVTS